MEYRLGMWVINRKLAEWGIGQVVGIEADKLKIVFSEAGEKSLVTRMVTLEEVPAPENRPEFRVRRSVDLVKLERLCTAFHEEFKDRRSNTDDGGMALRVLEDISARGDLTRASARRLFQWCHTGESYAQGVDLAQEICSLLYGRVPTRSELETAGFV
jgi:hypothetical protein